MTYRLWIYLAIILTVFTCSEPSKFSTPELTQQEEAWSVMMEGHDRAMPLIGEMNQTARALEEIAEKAMVAADDTHPRAMQALEALKNADEAMFDWMDHISQNNLKTLRERSDNHEAVMEFIAKEQKSINLVEEAMNSSLQQGKALVQEKSNL